MTIVFCIFDNRNHSNKFHYLYIYTMIFLILALLRELEYEMNQCNRQPRASILPHETLNKNKSKNMLALQAGPGVTL